MRLSLFSICVLLFLAVCTQAASSPSVRGNRQLTSAARRLEDQQAEEGEAQDGQQEEQDEEQEEQDAEEEEADDFFDYEDEENTGGQMFETAPENWTAEQWLFMVCLFAGWGALTSCICATGWLFSCFKQGPKEQPSSYVPSSPASKADRARSDSPEQDYVAMTGTEYDQQTGAYS